MTNKSKFIGLTAALAPFCWRLSAGFQLTNDHGQHAQAFEGNIPPGGFYCLIASRGFRANGI
ncbi:MAG: hypothetical protein R3B95_20735 [Nitrospirales bacterium]|nr:hypothetical protein [Nitrospirales bacterium]